ncbi:MAG: AAA family ATPase [Thermodesulfobacteriota bacterium]
MAPSSVSINGVAETLSENEFRLVLRVRGGDSEPPVLVHQLKSPAATRDEEVRFAREYEIIRGLSLPGLVTTRDVRKADGGWQVVLEDFQGVDLKSLIAAGPLEIRDFLTIAMQLAETLGQIHQAGLIHRAVRPAHILVAPETRGAKLHSFGIETLLTHEDRRLTRDYIAGILPYISPEQTGRMNRSVDYRTDMYSLGVTLYEMITGRLPFQSDDPMELIHAHIARTPREPHEVRSGLPAPLDRIILRLLAKTAEERYQNCFGLLADLSICRDSLQRSGRIEAFELGRRDISMRFNIPQKLVGREQEIGRFLGIFERVAGGCCEMMLVSGYPGIGKSALIHEIHKPIVARRGYFISGKYEQFRRDVPYSSIIQAFQGLIQQILTEEPARTEEWKLRLQNALGPNGGVITEVIPSLEILIGPQPEPLRLGPEESQNRFNLVFRNFAGVFAGERHPLVLFLDDLQWADTASLNLIRTIMTGEDLRYSLIIGAYRHNEVGEVHPLKRILEDISRSGGRLHDMFLGPITVENVRDFLMEIVKTDRAAIQPLADLVHAKTGGNPFFVNQFMKSLYDGKLLLPDPRAGWQWDVEKIQRMQVTDNVVELLSRKIVGLKPETREILKIGACVGNRFDLETLSAVMNRSMEQVVRDMTEAIDEGLVAVDTFFVFRHDRIQEAAYSLIPESDARGIHLRIGRLFLDHLAAWEKEKKVFYVVNQLNLGRELLTTPAERRELAELNRIAARRARESNAYDPALKYIDVGMALLETDCWETQYDLAFGIHLERAECEYANARYEQAERLFDLLLEKAEPGLARAAIHHRKVSLYASMVLSTRALQEGLSGLRQLGVMIPERPGRHTVWLEMSILRIRCRRDRIERLLHLPEMTDRKMKLVMEILALLLDSAYYTNQQLLVLLLIKMIRLSMTHGNSPASAMGYCGYGMLMGSAFGDYRKGLALGELALQVHQRYHDPRFSCKLMDISVEFIAHWRKPLGGLRERLDQGLQKGIDTGDFNFSALILTHFIWNGYFLGHRLDRIEAECRKAIAFLAPIRNPIRWIMHIALGLIAALRGQSGDPFDFDTGQYSESRMKKTQNIALLYWSSLLKLHLCILLREYGKAEEYIAECRKNLPGAYASPIFAEFYFLALLVKTAGRDSSPGGRKKRLPATVRRHLGKLRKWADNCPENYGHKYFLASAEMARIKGDAGKAEALYDRAIASARENGMLHHAALAAEYAAHFWEGRGKPRIASAYRREALDLYAEWGATFKVEWLRNRYPDLRPPGPENQRIAGERRGDGAVLDQMDYLTVVNSLQAISTEIVLENLLKRLMKTVMENAGAGRGLFISVDDGKLTVEAEASVSYLDDSGSGAGVQTLVRQQSLSNRGDLLLPAVHQVVQSRGSIVLDDASGQGGFGSDPYVIRERPRSILCLPVICRNRLAGLLYLENNKARGAFTPNRIGVLELLASQAAISLENARLYENIKHAEERMKNILETANEGFWEVDARGFTRDVNPEMCRILGRRREEVVGRHIFEFGSETSIAESKRQKEILQRGEKLTYEAAALRPDGTEVMCLFKATPLFQGDRHTGAFSMVSDITERRKAEEEIRKLNADLERRVSERTLELKATLKKVERANRHMLESIRYAKTIQQALLPDADWVTSLLPASFFIYEPKEMIGGDIYHVEQTEDGFVVAVMDCTGHGVPGAFMTMIAASAFQTISRDEGCHDPAEMLQRLNYIVKTSLQQDTGRALSDDGLDAAVCRVDLSKRLLTYAGARLPLLIFSEGGFRLIKGDRRSIGYASSDLGLTFTNHDIPLNAETRVYLYTDGFIDQLGGLRRRRFSSRRLRELLQENVHRPFPGQRETLLKAFRKHKGMNEQQDDVTVIGFAPPL